MDNVTPMYRHTATGREFVGVIASNGQHIARLKADLSEAQAKATVLSITGHTKLRDAAQARADALSWALRQVGAL